MPDTVTVIGTGYAGGPVRWIAPKPPTRWQRFVGWLARWLWRLAWTALVFGAGYVVGKWL